jgi:putative ABC transport system permease protein
MLVRMLSGVFDPPPSALTVPWSYLAVTASASSVAIGAVSAAKARLARRSPLSVLHDL